MEAEESVDWGTEIVDEGLVTYRIVTLDAEASDAFCINSRNNVLIKIC